MPDQNTPCPLPEGTCDTLNTVLTGCAILKDWLSKARAAGLPCVKHEADAQRMEAVATGIKQQFFPNNP